MGKKDKDKKEQWFFLKIAIIAVIVIFAILYLYLPTDGAPAANITENITATPTPEVIKIVTTETVTETEFVDIPTYPDLRDVALPYDIATDARNLCQLGGGEWFWETDLVGCRGVGALNCTDGIHLAARHQCEAVGGTWVCDMFNMFCTYREVV